jgi:hypothetical protein
MRRPKSAATIQVNLRFDADLMRRLETAAKGRATTFSQEIRERLINSFIEVSLADSLTNFKRRARDIVEHSARKEDIETAWQCLQELDAACAGFYTAVENQFSPYVRDPRVRELLRGAPALPAETASEPKSSQQRKGRQP